MFVISSLSICSCASHEVTNEVLVIPNVGIRCTEGSTKSFCHFNVNETGPFTRWTGGWMDVAPVGLCGEETNFLPLLGSEPDSPAV
jgi:hypothetical protein